MQSIFTDIDICPFTGFKLQPENTFKISENILLVGYRNPIIKEVVVSHSEYISLRSKFLCEDEDYFSKLFIFSGIIRNHFEEYKTPFYVNSDFIVKGYKEYSYPSEFNDKAQYFLKYLYNNGGNEGREFQFVYDDYALAYAKSKEEFQKIIGKLIKQGFIEYVRKPAKNMAGVLLNFSIELTPLGEKEVEKNLPAVPLFGLVNQDVFTGDTSIDDKILHAKKLFFKSESTFDDKRSACETLSFVLEPIREELKTVLTDADVSAFFQIVNTFDIRHNKDNTKNIEHVEQLEWIFYSLLNSIICYYKLKNK